MSTAELKIYLIKSICSIEDISILEKIKDILLVENKEKGAYILPDEPLSYVNEAIQKYENGQFLTKEEEVYIFTPEQRKRIEIALEQCKNGECISDEDAQKEIEKWFEEQE